MVVVALVATLRSGKTFAKLALIHNGFIWMDVKNFLNYDSIRSASSRLDELFRKANLPRSPQTEEIPQDTKTLLATSVDFSFQRHSQHEGRKFRMKLLERRLLQYYNYNLVVTGISHVCDILSLSSRPFSFIIGIDAPVLTRFRRWIEKKEASTDYNLLEAFLVLDHQRNFGCRQCYYEMPCIGSTRDITHNNFENTTPLTSNLKTSSLSLGLAAVYQCLSLADIIIFNENVSLEQTMRQIFRLNLMSPCLLRPDYDSYFMQLAFETAIRSNCLRRSVGAVVTLHNKVIATGYNGTPTGCTNCLLGGCRRCSQSTGQQLDSCICVHAETNALLQAGLSRTRNGTLYVTCFPCLSCAKLIVQSEIECVVYFSPYDNSLQTFELLESGHIRVKQHNLSFRKKIAEFIVPRLSLVDLDLRWV